MATEEELRLRAHGPMVTGTRPDQPIIQVDGLTRRFGSLEAVRGISFTVWPGEIFGFLGPNGAGKSTTINMLCTLLRPTSGHAMVAGYDVVTQQSQVRASIGLIFQDPSLDERLTAIENLRFHAAVYGLPRQQAARRAEEVLRMVELWDRRDTLVRTFSGGMKRRLEIARGLMHYPRVLFLDEPTIGLDPQTRQHLWSYILALRQREGITMFLTTHYMDEAEHADRIAIMDHGQIIALDTPDGLKAMVGGDVIRLKTTDDATAARELAAALGLAPRQDQEGIMFEARSGEELVPRLVELVSPRILSISVRRPTLDDVFIKLTGHEIRDEEASGRDRMRAMIQRRSGRGR
jgi:ABC-2 type transport system ATP-binding protein